MRRKSYMPEQPERRDVIVRGGSARAGAAGGCACRKLNPGMLVMQSAWRQRICPARSTARETGASFRSLPPDASSAAFLFRVHVKCRSAHTRQSFWCRDNPSPRGPRQFGDRECCAPHLIHQRSIRGLLIGTRNQRVLPTASRPKCQAA
jgi:hypothetical protein